jgi:hypothetical protein
MLYQDTLTGLLHEVPDPQVQGLGEAQMVYDGLGNPLGFSFKRALGKLAAKALPLASAVPGPWGLIASRALPVFSRAMLSTGPPRPPVQTPMQNFGPPQMEPEPAGTEVGEMPPVYSRPGMYPTRPMIRQQVPARWIPASPAHWSRGVPAAMRPPIPAGWRRPQIPYTGVQPRRVYMRCAVWRGPGGLVPINPGQPPIAPPAGVVPGAPMGPRRPRRRHRR